MKILITGQQLDIGESLKAYIEEKVHEHVTKYFENAIQAQVKVEKKGKAGNVFAVHIIVNEGTGVGPVIKSDSSDFDVYNAVFTAVKRMEKQLRRYKTRIKRRHTKQMEPAKVLEATKYVLSPAPEEEVEEKNGNPLIVAEKPASIEHCSIEDAVMQMDLMNLPALTFINVKNNRLNIVYYRKDGNISWVDTKIEV